jgi:hypothetical protein
MKLESKIQSEIIKNAKLKGFIYIKIIKASESGHADLLFFKNGKTIFIEVKNEIGKQSELQKFREKQFKKEGFEYHLVRSLEQFKKII